MDIAGSYSGGFQPEGKAAEGTVAALVLPSWADTYHRFPAIETDRHRRRLREVAVFIGSALIGYLSILGLVLVAGRRSGAFSDLPRGQPTVEALAAGALHAVSGTLAPSVAQGSAVGSAVSALVWAWYTSFVLVLPQLGGRLWGK